MQVDFYVVQVKKKNLKDFFAENFSRLQFCFFNSNVLYSIQMNSEDFQK